MALSEHESNITLDTPAFDFDAIRSFLADSPEYTVFDVKRDVLPTKETELQSVPHVEDLDTFVSQEIEREIATETQIPTVRRPLSKTRRAIVAASMALLGGI